MEPQYWIPLVARSTEEGKNASPQLRQTARYAGARTRRSILRMPYTLANEYVLRLEKKRSRVGVLRDVHILQRARYLPILHTRVRRRLR